MTPQYTQEQYEKSSSTEHLPMQCEECGKVFTKIKSESQRLHKSILILSAI